MNRAERRARTEAKTLQRQRFLRSMDDERAAGAAGHWHKRHPYDCGHTQCMCCHAAKLLGRRATERRAVQQEINE